MLALAKLGCLLVAALPRPPDAYELGLSSLPNAVQLGVAQAVHSSVAVHTLQPAYSPPVYDKFTECAVAPSLERDTICVDDDDPGLLGYVPPCLTGNDC